MAYVMYYVLVDSFPVCSGGTNAHIAMRMRCVYGHESSKSEFLLVIRNNRFFCFHQQLNQNIIVAFVACARAFEHVARRICSVETAR